MNNKRTILQISPLPSEQQGATLFVALIILVLISLIGVATLKSATVVEKMASSDYQKNMTFQASESAVARSLQNRQNITDTIKQQTVELNNFDTDIENTDADVLYTYVGFGPVEGASIGENGVSGQRIMITSTGQLSSSGTETNYTKTVHGMVQVVPGIGDGN